ncbi:MAG: hypothetical protein V3W43_05570 [Desulfatiglandaceae bacterium]
MKKLFIFGFAALLLVAFTAPAMAKVKMGGIIFTDFYYLDRDKNNAGSTEPLTNTRIEVPGITRLNGRWTNEDNVGMFIEFGLGGALGATDTSLRHAYGWWDVSPMFTLMAGHSTTPFSQLNPSQLLGTNSGSLNIIGLGYGDFYSGRFPQVRGTFRFGKVARLEIALVDPSGGNAGPWPATAQNNSKLPRVDIAVPLHFGPVRLYPGFLVQQKSVDLAPAGVDDSITTYIGTIGAKAGFGPFGIAAEGNWGKNVGNTRMGMGNSPSTGTIASATLLNTNQIHDAETFSFWIDASFKFGPATPHLMYGLQESKNQTAAGANTECRTQMIGISVPISLAKGFSIRPEFMWYDDGDIKTSGSASVDNGKYSIYGVQFQITF